MTRSRKIVRGQNVEPENVSRAKQLRREMTPAERALWMLLRRNALDGFHFRRQQVIEGFIVDFYCDAAKLAIELDGTYMKNGGSTTNRRTRLSPSEECVC